MCTAGPSHYPLTLKGPSKIVVDNYLSNYISEKIRLDISCESSAWQMIHKMSSLIFSKIVKKKKTFQNVSAAVVIGTFKVKYIKRYCSV